MRLYDLHTNDGEIEVLEPIYDKPNIRILPLPLPDQEERVEKYKQRIENLVGLDETDLEYKILNSLTENWMFYEDFAYGLGAPKEDIISSLRFLKGINKIEVIKIMVTKTQCKHKYRKTKQ